VHLLDDPSDARASAAAGVGRLLDSDQLAAIADRIAADPPLPDLPPGDHRRWVLVERGEHHDAWLIAWPAGTGLAMHDHRGSRAALRVVAGELRERYVTDAREVAVRWLSPDAGAELASDHVHEVVNVGQLEAVSVHVYSPAITDAGFRTDPDLEIGPRRS
jgi:hypothetical protein